MKKHKSEIHIEIFKAVVRSFKVHTTEEEIQLGSDSLILNLNAEFGVDQKEKTVGIKISLEAIYAKTEDSLFELVSFFEFEVLELNDVLIESKEKHILEPEFARKLLHISIGGSRGMLSVLLSPTQYHNFTLPIANIPDDFFDDTH